MGVKTGSEIEADIYTIVRVSLQGKVTGSVYRKGARPTNRGDKEDAVVGFLSGRYGDFQHGVVIVNCYVPMKTSGDTYKIRNVKRCQEVSRYLLDIVDKHRPDDYLLKTREIVTVEEDGDSTMCTLRIDYRYNTTGQ